MNFIFHFSMIMWTIYDRFSNMHLHKLYKNSILSKLLSITGLLCFAVHWVIWKDSKDSKDFNLILYLTWEINWGQARGSPESQQPTESHMIRICMGIYLKLKKIGGSFGSKKIWLWCQRTTDWDSHLFLLNSWANNEYFISFMHIFTKWNIL